MTICTSGPTLTAGQFWVSSKQPERHWLIDCVYTKGSGVILSENPDGTGRPLVMTKDGFLSWIKKQDAQLQESAP